MKPDKEIRICDLCNDYYAVFDNPDFEFIYLNKKLDVCHNCYNSITRAIQQRKTGVPKNVEYVD